MSQSSIDRLSKLQIRIGKSFRPGVKLNNKTKAPTPRLETIKRSDIVSKDAELALLVDGSNMFVRCCSVPNLAQLTNAKGQKTGGIFGVVKSLFSEMRRWSPEYVYFVVDRSGSNRRKKLFKEYKANRGKGLKTQGTGEYNKEEREEYEARMRQLDVLQNVLPDLGIRFGMIPGLEADDILAHLTKQHPFNVLVSTDSDFTQLHNNSTTWVFNPITKRFRSVEKDFAIGSTYAVLKSIIGDTSDNIDGLYRVGWKTVVKWCDGQCPQTMGDLWERVKDDDHKLSVKIRENWELIERNFQLISLEEDVLNIAPQTQQKINSWKTDPLNIRGMDALRTLSTQEDIGRELIMDFLMLARRLKT